VKRRMVFGPCGAFAFRFAATLVVTRAPRRWQ
jgi:hypothetical protein